MALVAKSIYMAKPGQSCPTFEDLIKKGKAYVDDTDQETMRRMSRRPAQLSGVQDQTI